MRPGGRWPGVGPGSGAGTAVLEADWFVGISRAVTWLRVELARTPQATVITRDSVAGNLKATASRLG